MSTRSQARGLARSHGLGELRGVHRERLPVWTAYSRYAILLTGFTVLLCAFRNPVPAIVLAVVVLSAVYGYANLAEITTPVGRRWIAVFDGGLVVLAEFADPIVLRWNGIDQSMWVPRRPRHATGTGVNWTRTVFYEPYQVSGHDVRDHAITVPIGSFTGRARLVAYIEEQVSPLLLFRARNALISNGQAVFGPVAVTKVGLEVTIGEALYVVTWSKFHADDERIMPLLPSALNTHPQLAAIPVNRALLELIAELRPGQRSTGDVR